MSRLKFNPLPKFTPDVIARFWKNVDKTPGQGPKGKCWTWRLSKNTTGHAQMSINGKLFYIHRIAYALKHGRIPRGKQILHKCDNAACVRCVYAGTPLQNVIDCRTHGRWKKLSDARHPNAKLTGNAVQHIRISTLTTKQLAALYDVAICTINRIKSKSRWLHT